MENGEVEHHGGQNGLLYQKTKTTERRKRENERQEMSEEMNEEFS